jgi:hypothetical protein
MSIRTARILRVLLMLAPFAIAGFVLATGLAAAGCSGCGGKGH